MICVTCRAVVDFKLLLDCADEDPAIAIVKDHMRAAAMQVGVNLKQQDIGYEVQYMEPWLTAYHVPGV